MAIKALQEVAPMHRMKEKFLALLSQAKEAKKSLEIQSELPVSEVIDDIKLLKTEFGGGTHQYSLVEAVAQDIMYDCVVSILSHAVKICADSSQTTSSIDDPEFARIWDLLDIIQVCEDTGMAHSLWYIHRRLTFW